MQSQPDFAHRNCCVVTDFILVLFAARLQCYAILHQTSLNWLYIVSYSMLMSTRGSPIVPYSTTLPSTKYLNISWGSSIVPCGISSIFSLC